MNISIYMQFNRLKLIRALSIFCLLFPLGLLANAPIKALVVLAHPDDETMIAASLKDLKDSGAELHFIYATDGEGGRVFGFDAQPLKIQPPTEEIRNLRLKELLFAMTFVGSKSLGLMHLSDVPFRDQTGKPSRNLLEFVEHGPWNFELLKSEIVKSVKKIHPDLLITMGLDKDNHVHHKAVRLAVDQIISSDLIHVPAVMAFEETQWSDLSLGTEDRTQEVLIDRQNKMDFVEKLSKMYLSQPISRIPPHQNYERLYLIKGKLPEALQRSFELPVAECKGEFARNCELLDFPMTML